MQWAGRFATLAVGAAASLRTRADADGSGPSVPGGPGPRLCSRGTRYRRPGAPGLAWPGDQGLFCLPDALIQLTAGTKGGGPWALDKPAAGKPVRMFSIKCFLGDWKKKKKRRSQKNFSAEVNLFSAIKRSTG